MARSSRIGSLPTPRGAAGGRALGLLTLLALSVVGLGAGCAPGNPGLNIIYQVAPSDDCVWDPNGVETVAEPRFDLDPLDPALRSNIAGAIEFEPMYVAQFVVNNNLINPFNMVYPVTTDVNDITATSAEVELLDAAGRRLPGGFYRTRAGGVVQSGLGDQPGRGVIRVDVIPQTVAAALVDSMDGVADGDAPIVARVVIIGFTQSGSEIRTYPYILPIDLCYGCLYVAVDPPEGEPRGCTPGQDSVFLIGGSFGRTPSCIDSVECVSGLCVLGHCARDVI